MNKESEHVPLDKDSIMVDGGNIVTINYDELRNENQEHKQENGK